MSGRRDLRIIRMEKTDTRTVKFTLNTGASVSFDTITERDAAAAMLELWLKEVGA